MDSTSLVTNPTTKTTRRDAPTALCAAAPEPKPHPARSWSEAAAQRGAAGPRCQQALAAASGSPTGSASASPVNDEAMRRVPHDRSGCTAIKTPNPNTSNRSLLTSSLKTSQTPSPSSECFIRVLHPPHPDSNHLNFFFPLFFSLAVQRPPPVAVTVAARPVLPLGDGREGLVTLLLHSV